MLNWAIRYRPIVQDIQRQKPAWVLDVGSGAEGLQMFWKGSVVGVDLRYKRKPLHKAVKANALALPFADASCPFVVSCDLLEHLPSEQRSPAVSEMARVAEEHLVLVFPAGEAARQFFQLMAQEYRVLSAPEWLRQHLDYGLPDVQQVTRWLSENGWETNITWFEAISVHKTLLCLELRLGGKLLTYSLMRLFGPKLIEYLPIHTGRPELRIIMKCSRVNK